MHVSAGSSTISRLAGSIVAVWLCCAGPAWAGDGGGDVVSSQLFLGNDPNGRNGLCSLLGMTSCPQLPTLTQLVLEFSALQNSPPDILRGPVGAPDGIAPVGGLGSDGPNCSVAGNQGLPPCSQKSAITSVNPPLPSAPSNASSITSLGFTVSGGKAVPVAAGGTSFFSAVTSKESGQPDTLNLYYSSFPTNVTYPKGQLVAAVSLPLVYFNPSDGTEQPVPTTLQIGATCTGGTNCLTATAVGNFQGNGTQKRSPGDLGITVTLPSSPQSAPVLQVQVPLVVTGSTDAALCAAAITNSQRDVLHCGNDPAYFGVVPKNATLGTIGSPTFVNQVSGLLTAFSKNASGFPIGFLKGVNAGIAPYSAPLAVTGATTSNFGFCASFWGGSIATTTLNPAAAAFLSIGTDGTTYVSSPRPPFNTSTCPF